MAEEHADHRMRGRRPMAAICRRRRGSERPQSVADVVDISAQYMEVDENVSRRLRGQLAELGD